MTVHSLTSWRASACGARAEPHAARANNLSRIRAVESRHRSDVPFPFPLLLIFCIRWQFRSPRVVFWKRLLRRFARIVNKSSKKEYEKANKVSAQSPPVDQYREYNQNVQNIIKMCKFKMCKFNMFITAVCVLFLIKLRWPKNKSIYNIGSIPLTSTRRVTAALQQIA